MSIAALKTQAHQKIEEAGPEMLEWVLEVLGDSSSEKLTYTNADLAEFDRRVADFKSGKVQGMTSAEFRQVIGDKTRL